MVFLLKNFCSSYDLGKYFFNNPKLYSNVCSNLTIEVGDEPNNASSSLPVILFWEDRLGLKLRSALCPSCVLFLYILFSSNFSAVEKTSEQPVYNSLSL